MVSANSSTGTRILRKGAPIRLTAGARSASGVVHATTAEDPRRTTPKATARKNVASEPKPMWIGPRARVGERPAANASKEPIRRETQNHPGSLGTTVRGTFATRHATRTSTANRAMVGQLGTKVKVTTIPRTHKSFVPAQSRCSGLVPGTNRKTYRFRG
jgi:hypothetical protein